MTEDNIMHENGSYWVCRDRRAYTVMKNENSYSRSVQSFDRNNDGLSLAIFYCDHLGKSK